MSINKPEPAPAPSTGPACWDRAIEEWGEWFARWPLGHNSNTQAKIDGTHTAIIEAFRERDAMGAAKYGVRLRPHDGRDSLVDAAQELMDALVYLTKHHMEGGECGAELGILRRLIFTLVRRMETR